MKVYCKTCGIALTQDISLYRGESFGLEDGQDYIQPGVYTVGDGEYFSASEDCIIINKSDFVNVEDHPDGSRLNGCCGFAGCDGPNKVCINGHEVATEKSDCWMPNAVIFEKMKTFLK